MSFDIEPIKNFIFAKLEPDYLQICNWTYKRAAFDVEGRSLKHHMAETQTTWIAWSCSEGCHSRLWMAVALKIQNNSFSFLLNVWVSLRKWLNHFFVFTRSWVWILVTASSSQVHLFEDLCWSFRVHIMNNALFRELAARLREAVYMRKHKPHLSRYSKPVVLNTAQYCSARLGTGMCTAKLLRVCGKK